MYNPNRVNPRNSWFGDVKVGLKSTLKVIKDPTDAAARKEFKENLMGGSGRTSAYFIAGSAAVCMGAYIAAAVLSHGGVPAVLYGITAGIWGINAIAWSVNGYLANRARKRRAALADREVDVERRPLMREVNREHTRSRSRAPSEHDRVHAPPPVAQRSDNRHNDDIQNEDTHQERENFRGRSRRSDARDARTIPKAAIVSFGNTSDGKPAVTFEAKTSFSGIKHEITIPLEELIIKTTQNGRRVTLGENEGDLERVRQHLQGAMERGKRFSLHLTAHVTPHDRHEARELPRSRDVSRTRQSER